MLSTMHLTIFGVITGDPTERGLGILFALATINPNFSKV